MVANNVSGSWSGIIVYGADYEEHAKEVLYFEMELTQQDTKISGIAIDTEGLWPNPTPATITGFLYEDIIQFTKQYGGSRVVRNGIVYIDKSYPSPEIYYSGIYNEQTQTFSGKWTFDKSEHLHGHRGEGHHQGSGKWTMRRKTP